MNAKNYAYHMNVTIAEANGTFASVFAAIFLGFEVRTNHGEKCL